jgi:hypothetical protein
MKQRPQPHEQGWELWLYRRRRAGMKLTPAESEHLDSLAPWYAMFETMAVDHDEQDARVRADIRKHPHGYGFHKSLGQLPFDWQERELAELRPCDWKQARTVRFFKVTSARTPRRTALRRTARNRERRGRHATTRSSARSGDSGDDGPAEPAAGDHREAVVA